ncbi:MAG: DNA polymerase, partial [Treponema sp.]|nr:DNA polymerase [Treponema sp.]
MKNPDAVAHINIIGFRAAVAALLDRELRNRPYVIAGGEGRGIVWDVSPEALRANIRPGMALAAAARLVRDLKVEAPNPAAYRKVNGTLEAIISRYAPLWQNDGAGNIYLDISGTRRLFGSPADCVSRVQNEISNELGMEAAAAAAANKLVSKVASRTIRPEGLVEVRPGD